MSFQSLVGGADCGPVNPLASLKKQLDSERFQNNFQSRPSSSTLRPAVTSNELQRQNQLADGFIRANHNEMAGAHHAHMADAFSFDTVGSELDMLNHSQSHIAGRPHNWVGEFAEFQYTSTQALKQEELSRFDHAFQHACQPDTWTREFAMHQFNRPEISVETHNALEKAFEKARVNEPQLWVQEFETQQNQVTDTANSWADGFANITGDNELSETAGDLLKSIQSNDPRFSNSEFLGFMRKLRDGDVAIEGDKIVHRTAAKDTGIPWADEFEGQLDSTDRGKIWADDFARKIERNWAEDFTTQQSTQDSYVEFDEAFDEAFDSALANGMPATDDWVRDYEQTSKQYSAARSHAGADFDSSWKDAQTALPVPDYDNYQFKPYNVFSNKPLAELKHLNHAQLSLPESILVLEAVVQQDPMDAQAWYHLGARQQENEREAQAISALRKSVAVNPKVLDAWLALSVSYTNESLPENAYESLENWIGHHDQYKQLLNSSGHDIDRFVRICEMFIEATRLRPEHDLDPDVQIGLGVLFNLSEEYDKAVDCFEAALHKRPQDYLLWNKLGATLANSHKSSRAIDAYFHALQINPSYIRARYNLAVSCVNMSQYHEAAHHLIQALSLQSGTTDDNGSGGNMTENGEIDSMHNMGVHSGFTSSGVWDTLKMACLLMNRSDLAQLCDDRNLAGFDGEFD